jgi:hypothetical protein
MVRIEKPRRTGSSAFADDDGGVDDGGSPVMARSAATKQSNFVFAETKLDCFASLAMTKTKKAGIAPGLFIPFVMPREGGVSSKRSRRR